jgi:hypothetical protein
MKSFLLLFLVLLISYGLHAQMINNKVTIYLGYQSGGFQGKKMVQDGTFSSPSLFSNYHQLTGYSVKGLISSGTFISLGLGLSYSSASGWNLTSFNDYTNSTAKQYSLCPTIQFHNRYKPVGISNRAKVFFEAGPNFGVSRLKLTQGLFDIQTKNQTAVSQPLSSHESYLGLKARAGLELVVSQSFGFWFSYSLEYNRVDAKLFNDNYFSSTQIDLGLMLRFKNNKRYYY